MMYGLIAAILYFCVAVILQNNEHRKREKALIELVEGSHKLLEYAEGRWHTERQQLLDRIQAPSFDHLKQAEVRIIKAQKEEPAVKYELV